MSDETWRPSRGSPDPVPVHETRSAPLMPEGPPEEGATEEILQWCLSTLLDVSRHPERGGPQAESLALGTLSYLDDPECLKSHGPPINRGLLAMGVTALLAPERVKRLGRFEMFRRAVEHTAPFLREHHQGLMEAGRQYLVRLLMDNAARSARGARLELDRFLVTDAAPGQRTLPGEVLATSGRRDPAAGEPSSQDDGGPQKLTILGENKQLSSERRSVQNGVDAQDQAPVLFLEVEGPWIFEEGWRRSLDRWAATIAGIRDERILALRGVYERRDRLYLVHDAFSGRTLEQDLRRGPVREAEAIKTVERVALALRLFHERGQVFQRLTPDRILLDPEDHVKLFDVPPPRPSCTASEEDTLKEKGLRGESRYLAPEVCGGSSEPGPAADIYSLGILFCEMLLGEKNLPLIAGGKVDFWYRWHLDEHRDAVPLAEIDSTVSPHLSSLVSRMLAKRACHRIANIDEFLKDLYAVRVGRAPGQGARRGRQSIVGSGVHPVVPVPTAVRTRRWRTAVSVVGALGLTLGMTLVTVRTAQSVDSSALLEETSISRIRLELEEALRFLRAQDLDRAGEVVARLEAFSLPHSLTSAVESTAASLMKARELKAGFTASMERGRKAELAKDFTTALTGFREAATIHRSLAAVIERPDQPFPLELSEALERLEPNSFLIDAREAMRLCSFDVARKSVRLCMNNHPGTPAAKEADELDRLLENLRVKVRVFAESFQSGKRFEDGGQHEDAMMDYFKARLVLGEVNRLSGGNYAPLEAQEMADRIARTSARLWSIESPAPGEAIVAHKVHFRLQLHPKFFREVQVAGKSVPVDQGIVMVEVDDLKEGPLTIPVVATTIDGLETQKVVAFSLQKPVPGLPVVELQSIAIDASQALANIAYGGEDFRVEAGWVPGDGSFTVTAVEQKGLTLTLADGRRHFIPY